MARQRKLGTVLNDPLSYPNILSFERNVVPLWWITENRPRYSKCIMQRLSKSHKHRNLGAFFKEKQGKTTHY